MIRYKYLFILNFFISLCHGKNNDAKKSKWNLEGKPGDGYYIEIEIGAPKQQFNVLIDTGSSNLAIAGKEFPEEKSYYNHNNSLTYVKNGTAVKVAYTEGWWEGYVAQDEVSIPSIANFQPVLSYLSIITNAHGFYVNESHWQGILGLAFPKIAQPYGLVVSWFDSLVEVYPVESENIFHLELCGPSQRNRSEHIGRFSIGASNYSCLKSEYSTPIHHRWFYEVIVTKILVGETLLDISCIEFNDPMTIIDSGTSNLQLSSTSYNVVISELRKRTNLELSSAFWNGHEEICFEDGNELWDSFPSLSIYLSHGNWSEFGLLIDAQSYLRPALNVSRSGCWRLGIEKAEIGTVLGTVVMEGFCITFDRNADKIFFSESECGTLSTRLLPITNKTDFGVCYTSRHGSHISLIVIAVFLALILSPLLVALVRYIWTIIKPKLYGSVSFITLDERNT